MNDSVAAIVNSSMFTLSKDWGIDEPEPEWPEPEHPGRYQITLVAESLSCSGRIMRRERTYTTTMYRTVFLLEELKK